MAREHLGFRILRLGGVVAVAAAVGCGGGGGGGGAGSATVSGNVSNASTSSVQSEKRSWLAWASEEVLGLARRVYAAAANTTPGGITVTVTAGGGNASAMTDSAGDFSVGGAPTGDVTVSFARGNCDASIPLSDVTDGSTLDMKGVAIACNTGNVSELDETFRGVLENKPASDNGNLNVCAFGGGGNHIRAVKTKNGTLFENSAGGAATFADLQDGDLIEVSGVREGIGGNSAVNAATLKIISSGQTGNCQGLSTPTPESTSTPTVTGTPATPTPTATPTP